MSVRDRLGSVAARLRDRLGRAFGPCCTCGRPTRSHRVGTRLQCHRCHVAGRRPVAADGGRERFDIAAYDLSPADGGATAPVDPPVGAQPPLFDPDTEERPPYQELADHACPAFADACFQLPAREFTALADAIVEYAGRAATAIERDWLAEQGPIEVDAVESLAASFAAQVGESEAEEVRHGCVQIRQAAPTTIGEWAATHDVPLVDPGTDAERSYVGLVAVPVGDGRVPLLVVLPDEPARTARLVVHGLVHAVGGADTPADDRENTPEEADTGGHKPYTDIRNASDADTVEAEDDLPAVAAMGGTTETDALPQQEDYESRQFEPSAGGLGRPTATLPIDQLEAIDPIQRRELASDRGQEWPSTDEARERLFRAITQTMRHEDDRVIDAPTSLGKSYAVAATPWGSVQYDAVTGGRPVVHLSKTRDARDEAVTTSQEADVEHLTLRARTEACPVSAGEYDPDACEGTDRQGLTVEGQPASEWLDMLCDERDLSLSVAHHYLEARLDQDVELPCSATTQCPAIAQWTAFREGDHSLVHATHNFAHVPGLRAETNMVLDEQADFQVDLSTDRVRRAITAYLRAVDAPVTTWEQFLTLARYDADGARTDADRERDALADVLEREPELEWYVDTPGAHAMAPALARALLWGEERANGRYVGRTRFAPPRLDEHARADEDWNEAYLTVVLDETNEVRAVWNVPDFGPARSVIGLDAHPALPRWRLNTVPWIERAAVLEGEERQLWRRHERGLRVVQVGEATRPLTSGEYFDYDGCEAVVGYLRERYGEDFRTGITASAVEGELRDIMRRSGIEFPATMHYGEEKSRNDFADEAVGFVNGCIDPGDGTVVDLLAALDCEARPERTDEDCGDCEGAGCEACAGTGRRREKGRGFEGPDADVAEAILASVRETHVAQAAGRYARSPEAPDATATVYVRTDALPEGFADVQIPGVVWTYGSKQEAVVEALRESTEPQSTRELAVAAGCSKKHARETVQRLAANGGVRAFERAGEHGATLYADAGVPQQGYVELDEDDVAVEDDAHEDATPEESRPRPYGGHYTWQVAIDALDGLHESHDSAQLVGDEEVDVS